MYVRSSNLYGGGYSSTLGSFQMETFPETVYRNSLPQISNQSASGLRHPKIILDFTATEDFDPPGMDGTCDPPVEAFAGDAELVGRYIL